MYIKNRAVSLTYKIAATAVSLTGVLLAFGFPYTFDITQLKYYTSLSNVLCFVFLAVSVIYVAVQMKKSGLRGSATFMPHLKGAVTLAITVTLLVYQFLLSGAPFMILSGGIGNFIIHLLTPVLVILDWLLFDQKGNYNIFDPLRWILFPICYLGYALIGAPLGMNYFGSNRYPYFFLDVDTLGAISVALYVIIITVFFLMLGYIVFALDQWMGKRAKAV